MIKKLIRKLLDRLFLRKFDDLKIQKGQLFEKYLESDLKNIKRLDQAYFKVFSQDTEDGIIQLLLKSLKINNVKFVEIGTQDYSESNTRYLYETMKCDGLIIDPFPNLKKKVSSMLRMWKNTLNIHNEYINSKNINEVLKKYSFDKDIDIFSIDIDGIDYWVLNSINPKISKIFIVEYNPYFGPKLEISAPNIDKFDRFNYHPTGFCWGMSLRALINLMDKKGFTFLGTNRMNFNSFFISKEFLPKINIELPNLNNLSQFTNVKFNVLKSKNKKYASVSDVRENIKDVEVFDLKQNKLIKLKEIIDQI